MVTVSRNNLWIGDGVSQIWVASDGEWPPQYLPDWNTDVDYDDFDWAGASNAFAQEPLHALPENNISMRFL